MPDRLDFDELGSEVRCIWCGEGGPLWEWPEERRSSHFHREHNGGQPLEEELAEERARTSQARRERRHRSRAWVAFHESRVCANQYCAVAFVPHRADRMYCSDRCRRAVARSRDDR